MNTTSSTGSIISGIKTLVFLAVLFAFTVAAIAPHQAAAASNRVKVSPVAGVGKLSVQVAFAEPTVSDQPAKVGVVNGFGQVVAVGYTDSTGVFTAKLAAGIYKVYVSAYGYDDVVSKVEVQAGALSVAKVVLMKSTSQLISPTDH